MQNSTNETPIDKKEAYAKAANEFFEDVELPREEVEAIFSDDNLERFLEIESNVSPQKQYYWHSLCMIHKSTKIDRYLMCKNLIVVDALNHIHVIARIIGDYLNELLGDSCGFCIDDLAECSYPEIQEVLMTMQKIETDTEYAYDGSIPTNFYELIKPLVAFRAIVDPDSKHCIDGGISDKYYKRLAKEVLGYDDFELPWR